MEVFLWSSVAAVVASEPWFVRKVWSTNANDLSLPSSSRVLARSGSLSLSAEPWGAANHGSLSRHPEPSAALLEDFERGQVLHCAGDFLGGDELLQVQGALARFLARPAVIRDWRFPVAADPIASGESVRRLHSEPPLNLQGLVGPSY